MPGIQHPDIDDPREIQKAENMKKNEKKIFEKQILAQRKWLTELAEIIISNTRNIMRTMKIELAEFVAKILEEEELSLKKLHEEENKRIAELEKILADQIITAEHAMEEIRKMYGSARENTKKLREQIGHNIIEMQEIINANNKRIRYTNGKIRSYNKKLATVETSREMNLVVKTRSHLVSRNWNTRSKNILIKRKKEVREKQDRLLEKLEQLQDKASNCTNKDELEIIKQQIKDIQQQSLILEREYKEQTREVDLQDHEADLLRLETGMSNDNIGLKIRMLTADTEDKRKMAEEQLKKNIENPPPKTNQQKEKIQMKKEIEKLTRDNNFLFEQIESGISELSEIASKENLQKYHIHMKNDYEYINEEIDKLKKDRLHMNLVAFNKVKDKITKEMRDKYNKRKIDLNQLKQKYNINPQEKPINNKITSKSTISEKKINNDLEDIAKEKYFDLKVKVKSEAMHSNQKEVEQITSSLDSDYKGISEQIGLLKKNSKSFTPEEQQVFENDIKYNISDMEDSCKNDIIELKAPPKPILDGDKEEPINSTLGKAINKNKDINKNIVDETHGRLRLVCSEYNIGAYSTKEPDNHISPVQCKKNTNHPSSGNKELDRQEESAREPAMNNFDELDKIPENFVKRYNRIKERLEALETKKASYSPRKMRKMCREINEELQDFEKDAKVIMSNCASLKKKLDKNKEKLNKVQAGIKKHTAKDKKKGKPSFSPKKK